MAFPAASASKNGNLVVNPSGTNPGELETFLRCPPWWALDLSQIKGSPDYRGENTVVATQPGRAPNPLRMDQGTYVVNMRVCGEVDASSNLSVASAMLQTLDDNMDFLWDNVGAPPTGSSTRTAKLIRPDGSSVTDEVQFKLHTGEQKGIYRRAAFEVIVPGGRFGA